MVDIVVPAASNMKNTHNEKIRKIRELGEQMRRVWNAIIVEIQLWNELSGSITYAEEIVGLSTPKSDIGKEEVIGLEEL